jgi:tetratricopeptide (TPR) repeat protein
MRLFNLILLVLLLAQATFAQKKPAKDKLSSAEANLAAEKMLIDGMKHSILEEHSKALDYFKKAQRLQPESAGIHFKIAETYLQMGRADEALPFAEKALALEKDNLHHYSLLSKVYQAANKYNQAAQTLEQLLLLAEDTPNGEQYAAELAFLYQYQLKDYKKAIRLYERLEKKYGIQESFTRQKQQIYIQQGRYDAAIAEAEKLYGSAPKHLPYTMLLAEMQIANNQADKAIKLLEKTVQEHQGAESEVSQLNLLLAELYKSKGQNKKADLQFEESLQNPQVDTETKIRILMEMLSDAKSEERLAEILVNAQNIAQKDAQSAQARVLIGDILLTQNKLAEARQAYLQGLELAPEMFQVWIQVLQISSRLQEADWLIQDADRALELYPNQALVWMYLGAGYFEKRDYEHALESFETGQSMAIGNKALQLDFTVRIADCYNGLKQYRKADELYEQVLKAEPQHPQALNNYSYFLALREERLEDARKMAQKLHQLQPEHIAYTDTYAWVLYKLGNYKEARKIIEKVVHRSQNGAVVEHYGDILFKLNEKEKALEQWQKAREMKGASPVIDKKISDKKLYEQ